MKSKKLLQILQDLKNLFIITKAMMKRFSNKETFLKFKGINNCNSKVRKKLQGQQLMKH